MVYLVFDLLVSCPRLVNPGGRDSEVPNNGKVCPNAKSGKEATKKALSGRAISYIAPIAHGASSAHAGAG